MTAGRGPVPDRASRLSKSRFIAGWQCRRRLWWTAHEPSAPELVPDVALEAVFERGRRVGELARTYVPRGVLIDLPFHDVDGKIAATAEALARGCRVVYEASFLASKLFASADILERNRRSFTLTEM